MSTPNNDSAYPDAVVRAAEPEDFKALKELYEQRGAYYGTLQMPYPSYEKWRERLANPKAGTWSLVACVDAVPIGNISLTVAANPRIRHVGHVGMAVHDAYAGRGIGQLLMGAILDVADNWINLSRVELTVYVDNERARRLYERNGFEVEGRFRRYAYRDGAFVDAIAMARLRQAAA